MKDKNTVTIDLEIYNQLRDFKKTIEENNTIRINSLNSFFQSSYNFITKDELSKEILYKNKELNEENIKLKENNRLEINKLKKMSVWEFIKWRTE